MKSKIIAMGIVLFFFVLTSCEDQQLNQIMDDYCECISAARNDQGKQMECIEKMDSIKKIYQNKPSKLNKVVKKSGECY